MGVTSFSGSTSSVSFSFKPTATNSNITALKFNSNNQPILPFRAVWNYRTDRSILV